MKRYRFEVYIFNGFNCELRYVTNNLDEACDKAHEIGKNSTEDFEGTVLYDNLLCKWFWRYERNTPYELSK